MHYRQDLFGGWKSEVDGPDFFLAPDGKTDPEAELRAALDKITSTAKFGKLKQPITCAFPLRLQFVATKFSIPFPKENCDALQNFLEKFHDPQSLSVVFSSAYPNNPASMFGHTFVKVNSIRHTDLLDNGVNFAAYASDDENPLKFVWFGLTGGYFGQWSAMPYYVKVQEYNNFESRDLWEYQLNLTPEETRQFIYHLWEIETNSYFYYYFFDKNCSYQILAVLEAVKPEWTLTEYGIHMIPGESIKNLYSSPGIVSNVKFRPSLYKKLWQYYNALTPEESQDFQVLIQQKASLQPNHNYSRLTLDTTTMYLQYFKSDNPEKFEAYHSGLYKAVLSQRSKLGILSDEERERLPIIGEGTRPDAGHDAYALHLQFGYHDKDMAHGKSGFLGIKIKSAYHDLLNNDLGYNSFSHIDFPAITGRYDFSSKKFYLSDATFLATTSLHPFTAIDHKISYKLDTGVSSFKEDFCYLCNYGFAEGGLGITLSKYDFKNRWYNFILLRFEGSERLPRGYRAGAGVESGLLLNPLEKLKAHLFTKQLWLSSDGHSYQQREQYGLRGSVFLTRNLELRQENFITRSKSSLDEFEASMDIIYFFN